MACNLVLRRSHRCVECDQNAVCRLRSFLNLQGPLKGAIPVLSLRTCKADVVVGIPEGVAEKLDADEKEKGWRVNGK